MLFLFMKTIVYENISYIFNAGLKNTLDDIYYWHKLNYIINKNDLNLILIRFSFLLLIC